jgi:FMN reductase
MSSVNLQHSEEHRRQIVATMSAAGRVPATPRSKVSITVLVGNPKADSRTLRVAVGVAASLLPKDSYTLDVVDLARYVEDVFVWPSERLDAALRVVAASDLLVVASPTYKASYTGLLKSFLDRYPVRGLEGTTAVAVMTGGDAAHTMSVDVHLRPLLVELGADLPSQSLYFLTSRMNHADRIINEWAEQNRRSLRRSVLVDRAADPPRTLVSRSA